MRKKYVVKCKKAFFILLLTSIIVKSSGNNSSDSLFSNKPHKDTKQLSLLASVGYRIPFNKNIIINSGHGIYIEGGINVGSLISKNFVLGLYGGLALQDRFWTTSFWEKFSTDYIASINREQHLAGLDSAIIYSSANLFKNTKGNAIMIPGCTTQSFHNYSMYYGIVFRLPFKFVPVIKLYKGTTRSHYQGDGNIVTQQKEYNIFELRRNMYGCEFGFLSINIKPSKSTVPKQSSKATNTIGLSVYYENCNFYNSSLYFDDGTTTKKIALQSFTTATFLKKYKNESSYGIKLWFSLM